MEIFISVSIGVSVADGQTTSMSEFMLQADLALYRAKGEGRNTYRFFEGAMNAATRRRVLLSQDLRGALERDELFLEYQPQISTSRIRGSWVSRRCFVGDIPGSASLLRPRVGADRGRCRPHRRSRGVGLANVVHAGTQLAEPRSAGAPSGGQRFGAAGSRTWLRRTKVSRILNDSGLEPRYLELELTENVLMEAKEHVGAAVETLHELGVGISLDDFGRGYASLDYVRRYPLSKIKIDSSFVQDMLTNRKSAAIVGCRHRPCSEARSAGHCRGGRVRRSREAVG